MDSLHPFHRGHTVKFQGIVLAGGKSSRFGEDKALALVGGIPMIQRVVNLLKELELDPCVITNASRDYSFLKCRIERDLIPEKGPMGGLYTACCLFENSSLVVLTCDMPALTSAAIKHLIECHKNESNVTLYSCNKFSEQPFPGIYEPGLRDTILKSIEMKQLSMQEFLSNIVAIKILLLSFDNLFLNINEQKDMKNIFRKEGNLWER